RDDLVLSLDGHLARGVASQGQHRALTLAIKAAESATIARVTGLEPIQLLDDVSSELDPTRTEALFSHLARRRAQIFVTTTRPDLVGAALRDAFTKRYRVVGGALAEA
ncbi:MAG TPA: DNA replication and repair protein RecF, partial [Polyangiaceae bacterium]|nr:DNA replication and repair protein RecF [Polyangiaceae bacterium]